MCLFLLLFVVALLLCCCSLVVLFVLVYFDLLCWLVVLCSLTFGLVCFLLKKQVLHFLCFFFDGLAVV